MITTEFEAFGSTAVVAVTEAAGLDRACAAVRETAAAFDRACSRFREDSELCAVNAAAGSPVQVSGVLFDAVDAAVRAAQLTDGDVDPTVGEALIALGYDRDLALVGAASRAPISIASVPGWRGIELDASASTIRVARGVKLDLGATAKALAADRAAAAASEAAECSALVSFGGDLAIAGEPVLGGSRVRVTDDHRSGQDAPGQWITLQSGGLATSSTMVRRWSTDSGTAHHQAGARREPRPGRDGQGTRSGPRRRRRACRHRVRRAGEPRGRHLRRRTAAGRGLARARRR